MPLNDIKITKIEKGLGRPAPVEDSTSALLMGGIALTADTTDPANPLPELKLDNLYLFYSVEDAEKARITKSYDEDNNVLVHHHISEYFRLAPGQPLYVYLVAQGTTFEQMCDAATANSLRTLLNVADGKIRQVGMVLNPAGGTGGTATAGIEDDVATAIPMAQTVADEVYALHYPVDIIIEGRGFDATTIGTVLDLTSLESENVSVVIAQDLDMLSITPSNGGTTPITNTGYAAVGTYLGMTASKGVADSPAEVGLNYQGNVQSLGLQKYINYGYGGKALNLYSTTDQDVIYDKRYVALRTFQGAKGVYFTQSFTCADAENDFIFLELSRTHNKAHRSIYKAYVPYINTKFRLTEQGLIPGEVVKYLENIGNNVFVQMQNNGEVSAGKTYIDPNQSVVLSRKLNVKWKMVPMGKLEAVDGELSFTLNLE